MSNPFSWKQIHGRNGWDHPLAIPDDMGREALNMSLRHGELGRKRPGTAVVTTTGGLSGLGSITHLAKFQVDAGAAQMMIFIINPSADFVLERMSSSNVRVTLTPELSAGGGGSYDLSVAQLDDKFYFAVPLIGGTRLLVYDPSLSTSAWRRVGLLEPAAPTVANTGAGAYAAIERWYRQAVRIKSGSTIKLQSELSPAVAFTPSGAGTAARVTKAAATGDGETHWVLYASDQSEDGPFYEIAETVVGTTTYDDSADPADYSLNRASPLIGAYIPFPHCTYLASDGTRLFGLGLNNPSFIDIESKRGRVYFTPAIGSGTLGYDSERIQSTLNQDDWVDLAVGAKEVERALAGPVNGRIYAFMTKGIYMLTPTLDPESPVRKTTISEEHGAMSDQSCVVGEDEVGTPCLYFLNPADGPRRIRAGSNIEWLGKDVSDIWDSVKQDKGTVGGTPAFGVFDSKNKQVKWWVSTVQAGTPDTMIVYHVALGKATAHDVRYGWAKWTGRLAESRTALMFPNELTATRPDAEAVYVGRESAIGRQDGASNKDFDVSYQAYVESKAFEWGPLSKRKRVLEAFITAKAAAVSLVQTLIKDWGRESLVSDAVSLAAEATETHVRRQVQECDVSDCITAAARIGDTSAADNTWQLCRWDSEIEVKGAK